MQFDALRLLGSGTCIRRSSEAISTADKLLSKSYFRFPFDCSTEAWVNMVCCLSYMVVTDRIPDGLLIVSFPRRSLSSIYPVHISWV